MTEHQERLEKAIDSAGRLAVFDMMRAVGWTEKDAPPMWVWWEVVRYVNSRQTSVG